MLYFLGVRIHAIYAPLQRRSETEAKLKCWQQYFSSTRNYSVSRGLLTPPDVLLPLRIVPWLTCIHWMFFFCTCSYRASRLSVGLVSEKWTATRAIKRRYNFNLTADQLSLILYDRQSESFLFAIRYLLSVSIMFRKVSLIRFLGRLDCFLSYYVLAAQRHIAMCWTRNEHLRD